MSEQPRLALRCAAFSDASSARRRRLDRHRDADGGLRRPGDLRRVPAAARRLVPPLRPRLGAMRPAPSRACASRCGTPSASRIAGSAVVAANHESFCDILVLLANLPFQLRFLAKRGVFRVPVLGWSIARRGLHPGRPGRPGPRRRDRSRRPGGFLPADARSSSFPRRRARGRGSSSSSRPGAALLALRSGLPLRPLGLAGTRRVLPPGTPPDDAGPRVPLGRRADRDRRIGRRSGRTARADGAAARRRGSAAARRRRTLCPRDTFLAEPANVLHHRSDRRQRSSKSSAPSGFPGSRATSSPSGS